MSTVYANLLNRQFSLLGSIELAHILGSTVKPNFITKKKWNDRVVIFLLTTSDN